jgi:LAS superfamily LD-carboxypeptidase LdcB
MSLPIVAVVRPSDLTGVTNGMLPAEVLVSLPLPQTSTGRVHRLAGQAWQAFAYEVFTRFAVELTATSGPDTYRSYAAQEALFRARYTTDVLPGRPAKVWQGQMWYLKPGMAMAATPGTSNHGWGLAVDTAIWRDGKVIGITADTPAWTWMQAHAHEYGLSWEAQSEPWHLRYFAGDRVPAAVEAWLNPPVVIPPPVIDPPPTDPPEVDVTPLVQLHPTYVIAHRTRPARFLRVGAECDWLASGTEVTALTSEAGAGIGIVWLEDTDSDNRAYDRYCAKAGVPAELQG